MYPTPDNRVRYEDRLDIQMSTLKCTVQTLIVSFVTLMVLLAYGPYNIAQRIRKENVVFFNFIVVLAFDQVKNVMCQPLIWWGVILRCGTISPGIQEFNEEYLAQWEMQDSLMTQIRLSVDIAFYISFAHWV